MAFAPILINFSLRFVSDRSPIGSGVAAVRRKLPRLAGARMKLEPLGVVHVFAPGKPPDQASSPCAA
jgi:hypothetical protein